ncbi:MAG: hypothetical protein HY905_25925 [Deltaproteobacteria bacterium]|nr:hypothetical protein [Deltaproteobacteria bacterium]
MSKRSGKLGSVVYGVVLCVGILAVVGCRGPDSVIAPGPPTGAADSCARFEEDGYYSEAGPFRIAYVDATTRAVMGPGWMLDNWMPFPNGSPRTQIKSAEWMTELLVDAAEDGRYDFTAEIPKFDLHWTERHTGALIWIRSLPLSRRLADRDLSVIGHDWVEEIAGGEWWAACLGGCAVGEERHWATTLVSEELTFVSGVGAFDVTFDIANVDQLQLDPDARTARARLVLVRPGYRMPLRGGEHRYEAPTLVALGYAQTPDRFDEHAAEFEDLLRRIDFWPGGVPVDGSAR